MADRIFPRSSPSGVEEVGAIAQPRQRIKPGLNHYGPITDKNIFTKINPLLVKKKEKKSPPSTATVSPDAGKKAVESKLGFKLVGTSLRNGKGFMAFMEEKRTKKQSGYRLGDSLGPSAIIVAIERKRVIVDRNGVREFIEFADNKGKKKAGKRAEAAKSGGSGVASQSHGNWMIEKRYLDAQLNNMGKLMTQVRAVPAGKDGFKVFNIAKGSLFEKIGLKNGDTIRKINGMALSTPEKSMQIYQQLRNASDISVDVLRNGNVEKFTYSIR